MDFQHDHSTEDPSRPLAAPGAAQEGSHAWRAEVRLRDEIFAGVLAAGTRLTEQMLAQRFGASRTPIRAALMRLAGEGLLVPAAGGGFAVQSYSEVDVSAAIEIRGTLEGLAVRLAAERGLDDVQRAALEDALAEMETVMVPPGAPDVHPETDGRVERYMNANARFHRLIVALPGSKVLIDQVERISRLAFASPSSFVRWHLDPELAPTFMLAHLQHRLVVQAIVARQGERAESLMREHARLTQHNLMAVLSDPVRRTLVPGAHLLQPAEFAPRPRNPNRRSPPP